MNWNIAKWMGMAAVLVLAVPSAGRAAEVTVGTDIATAYVWRGLTLNDEGAIQPSIDISHESGLNLNIWGNFDIGDFNSTLESGEFSEVDLTLSYAVPIEEFDFTVGVIHYLFPQGASTTTELFMSGSVSPYYDPLTIGLDFYYDVDEVSDLYANVNAALDLIALGLDLGNDQFGMELSADIGFSGDVFARNYGGGTESGAREWNIGLNVTYAWTDTIEVNGFINFTDNLDKDVLPDQPTDIWGGTGVYYSF